MIPPRDHLAISAVRAVPRSGLPRLIQESRALAQATGLRLDAALHELRESINSDPGQAARVLSSLDTVEDLVGEVMNHLGDAVRFLEASASHRQVI